MAQTTENNLSGSSSKESRRMTWLFLTLVCIAAWALRMLPFRQVFTPEGVFFYEADPYYHLRRIMLIVQHFPQVPVFDHYMAYPEGAYCFWPPLFDFFIACVAMVTGLGHPSQRLMETVAALIPPVLGAITVIPVFFLARMIFNRTAAFIAALAFAMMPAHIAYSTVGRVDHHVAEVLLSIITSVFLLKALATPSRADRDSSSDFSRYSLSGLIKMIRPWTIAAGVAMGAMFLVQSASTVYAGVLFAFVAVQAVVAIAGRKDPTAILGNGAGVFAAAAVVILPFCKLDPWIGSSAVLRLSWFHLALLAGAALSLALWGMTWKPSEGQRHPLRGVLLVLLAGVAAVGAMLLIAPGLWDSLEGGLTFVSRSDSWTRTIVESRPLFRSIEILPPTAFAEVELSWGLYLAPLALGLILYREKPTTRPEILYLLIATFGVGALALMQQRFASAFAVYVSLCIGYLVSLVPAAARRLFRLKEVSPGFGAALLGLALVLVLYPSFSYFAPLWRSRFEAADRFFTVPDEFYKALKWMSKGTPTTTHFDSPSAMPEYGVLCEWDKGHWVEYIAQRPVLANNFGSHLCRQEFVDSIKFYLAPSEAEAMAIVKRYNVRYVVTTPMLTNVQDHATIAERTDVVYVKRSIAPNGERRMVIFPAYFSLIGVQLHESDGRAFDVKVAKGSRLPHFRLVYEGNSDPAERGVIRMIPVKIFEVVRGARVKGQVQPSTEVNASVMIKTNIGRSFKYSAAATADGRGHFEMILPYSTTGGAAPVQAEGDYTLTCGSPRSNPQQSVGPGLERGEQKTTVRVPESVVEGGGRVQVVWPKQKMRP